MSSYVRVSGRVPPAETLVLQERAGQNGALAIGRCDRLQFLAVEENSCCRLHWNQMEEKKINIAPDYALKIDCSLRAWQVA